MSSGFVILDKPSGMTSRQAAWRVARVFGAKTFGHVGTLDPMASGLLPVALGGATKMISFLELDAGKEYLFSIRWGVRTDSGDLTGRVLEHSGGTPSDLQICRAAAKFSGMEYDQAPPMFSAKKVAGVPAYVLARRGIKTELMPKRVSIFNLSFDSGIFFVKCGTGTYVRSLVQDIIAAINEATGQHFTGTCDMIRRVFSNGFSIKIAQQLDFLEKMSNNANAAQFLWPLDFGLDGIPVAEIKDARLFRNGGCVLEPVAEKGLVRVYSGGSFIGMGIAGRGIRPKRVIA
ncbi:MAG: tRNA pseudouridine(55) synthase TruB [Rickettsiales bacterium]|jgi:tRNA pseudouridine55 synthase|nr:tRNA pseudouridine(55) synthase TruB [Rickettsiales bacterium]